MHANSGDLRQLHPLSSSLQTASIVKDVKVERIEVHITLLSDDSDTELVPSLKDGQQSSHVSICSTSGNA